jgi:hypothetical protein
MTNFAVAAVGGHSGDGARTALGGLESHFNHLHP